MTILLHPAPTGTGRPVHCNSTMLGQTVQNSRSFRQGVRNDLLVWTEAPPRGISDFSLFLGDSEASSVPTADVSLFRHRL
jgi:hypothetical protein